MVEVTVILKDAERTYKEKFLVYERIDLWHDSEQIQGFVKQACASFKAEPTDITIKITLDV